MALSPAAGAGALILSCYSEGERDLAARSDSEHLGCTSNIKVDVLVEPRASMTGFFCLKLWVTISVLAFFMVRRMVHGNCRVVSWILMQLPICGLNLEGTTFPRHSSFSVIAASVASHGSHRRERSQEFQSCSDDVDETFTRSWCMFHRQKQGKRQHWKYFFYPYQRFSSQHITSVVRADVPVPDF